MVAGLVLDLEADDEAGKVLTGVRIVHCEVAGRPLVVLGCCGRQLLLPRLHVV